MLAAPQAPGSTSGGNVADWLKSTEAKQIRESIDWHLANLTDDRSLRERLEGMATGALFKVLSWYWAPRLYARNRAMFRHSYSSI